MTSPGFRTEPQKTLFEDDDSKSDTSWKDTPGEFDSSFLLHWFALVNNTSDDFMKTKNNRKKSKRRGIKAK